MKEEKIIINDAPQVPEYKAEQAAESNKVISFSSELNTLDEPISTTILRDLKEIGYKMKCVMVPALREEASKRLKDWDLWGPLVLCLALSMILAWSHTDGTMVFQIVFVVVWLGSAIVTVNGQLLGGTISFFQSICVLGYCLCPLTIAALLVKLFMSSFHVLLQFIFSLAGFIWSTYSSYGFLSDMVQPDRKALAVYPLCLFYLFLALFVVL